MTMSHFNLESAQGANYKKYGKLFMIICSSLLQWLLDRCYLNDALTPLLTMSVRLSVSMTPTIVSRNIPKRVRVVKFIPFLPVSDTEEPRVLNPTGFTNVARLSDKNLAA